MIGPLPSGEQPFVPRIYPYNYGKYDFRAAISRIFGVSGSGLDGLGFEGEYETFKRGTDQSSGYHRKFYASWEREVEPLYRSFIAEAIAPVVPEPFIYQKVPTFRVHLPGNVAVGEFHTDAEYNHPEGEVNFWLPVTSAFRSNSIAIQMPGIRGVDFMPVEYGEVLVFDAVRYYHGNVRNLTGRTRVSIDFRILLKRLYKPTGLRTVNTGSLLEIGDYYAEYQP